MKQRIPRVLAVFVIASLLGACDKEIREAKSVTQRQGQLVQLYNIDAAGVESRGPTAEELAHGPRQHL